MKSAEAIESGQITAVQALAEPRAVSMKQFTDDTGTRPVRDSKRKTRPSWMDEDTSEIQPNPPKPAKELPVVEYQSKPCTHKENSVTPDDAPRFLLLRNIGEVVGVLTGALGWLNRRLFSRK